MSSKQKIVSFGSRMTKGESTPNPDYEDSFCIVDENGLHIKTYYFPFGLKKHVAFPQIEDIRIVTYFIDPGAEMLKLKSWGMGLSWTWWACDMSRSCSNNKGVLLKVRNDSMLKGFSVEDPDAFMSAVKHHLKNNAAK